MMPKIGTKMTAPLISFGGTAGSGKDTFSAFLAEFAETNGVHYETAKFATDLRKAMSIITDIPIEHTMSAEDKARPLPNRNYTLADLRKRVEDAIVSAIGSNPTSQTADKIITVITGEIEPDRHENLQIIPMTIGRFLQVLGTDAFRTHVGENVWVDAFRKRWETSGRNPTMVPDDRFPNETALIKELGGVAIYISRPGNEGRGDGRLMNHPSEQKDDSFLKDFDIIVVNGGSLEDRRVKTAEIWSRVKEFAASRVK
jgi:hypothetical protein